jgi:hypothetical protein
VVVATVKDVVLKARSQTKMMPCRVKYQTFGIAGWKARRERPRF